MPDPCQYLAIVGAHRVCLHCADHRLTIHADACGWCSIRDQACALPKPVPTAAELEAAIKSPRKMPSLARRALNLAAALSAFVADGCRTVDAATYQARLEVCGGTADTPRCDQQDGNWCAKCGCHLAEKARMRSQDCPAGKWANPTPAASSAPPAPP